MGNSNNGCCNNNSSEIYESMNCWDLAECIKEKNDQLIISCKAYDLKFKEKIEKYLDKCEEYISILKSIPNNRLKQHDFDNIKYLFICCYMSIEKMDRENFEINKENTKNFMKNSLPKCLGVN